MQRKREGDGESFWSAHEMSIVLERGYFRKNLYTRVRHAIHHLRRDNALNKLISWFILISNSRRDCRFAEDTTVSLDPPRGTPL